ncbi:MAG: membrane dipeptidase [Alloprevotella sp.]|nr:membrane dipeptidase [Alloprevotella sp.]
MMFDIYSDYNTLNDHFPNHTLRPVIGITANFGDKGAELAEGYFRSIEMAGGIPVVIPITENHIELAALLDRIDGLVLSGGADINPLYLGEDPIPQLGSINPRRDRMEILLTRLAYDRQLPILGICRGIQVLTAVLGGKLYQDIQAQSESSFPIKHSQDLARGVASHFVDAVPGSIVQTLLGDRFAVNSFHHQAVSKCGPLLRPTAYSADGIIEAVESTEYKSVVGVQWHPECFILEDDRCMHPLFRWFVEECESYRRACDVHSQVLTLDSHVDTPMFFSEGVRFDHRDPKVKVDMHKLTEGRMDSVIMAAYLRQEERSEEGHRAATEKARSLLMQIKEMVDGVRGAQIAYTPKDAFRIKSRGQKAIFLGIENGYAIGHDLSLVEDFRRMGVAYMTLCHNGDNDICDSASRSNGEHSGLSAFGRDVVREMNRVGMMVDLSHAAESTFYDVLDVSQEPVICSHSSSRFLCDHPRNLTDDQLRAIAEVGGVAQATFYPGFLRTDGEATIKDAVRHILHMIDVAGVDHVGVGSDFDGDGGVPGLNDESEMINLTRRLMAEGFGPTVLKKIWGGNIVRVMSQVQYHGSVKFGLNNA